MVEHLRPSKALKVTVTSVNVNESKLSLRCSIIYHLEIDHKVKPSEPFLVEYMNNFFSTLLVVPVGGVVLVL